ncbi:putative AbiEi antitoxin of type IV toxin-antitoxin system [Propioniferax innocua]|uniref:Putative AbiEi antitoxin of type IV toxin-antitoxin system n=1 Tax=Propioniferax innocua TaxID=1753 RepID=A0A542ZSE2_9ACTN|nr:putative AbiEi antitoxin of type IV toxin-antitoxin system [Propioniferax innocua]
MVCGVHARQRLPHDLISLAARQHGILTSSQLQTAGISRKVIKTMSRDGRLHWLARGHYSIHSPSLRTFAHAGAMIGGPRAAVGGLAAAQILDLQVSALPKPETITIWVEKDRRVDPRPRWEFRQDCIGRLERAGQNSRVIDRHDVLLDVSESLPSRAVIGWFLDCLREGQVSAQRLRHLLDARARHKHRWFLHGVIADAVTGIESALEHQYVTQVEKPHGLPIPQRQVVIAGHRSDAWFPEQRVTLELDGWNYHKDTIRADAHVDAKRAALGIVPLHIGWEDVIAEPCRTAQMIADVLRTRGWLGSASRCRSCLAHTAAA